MISRLSGTACGPGCTVAFFFESAIKILHSDALTVYPGQCSTGRNMRHDSRIKQANTEALLALAVYGLYFVWWYVFGYGVGNEDPETYSYVLGFPAWFFYSCILGYPLVTVVLWVVVRLFFREIPLDADVPDAPCEIKEDNR